MGTAGETWLTPPAARLGVSKLSRLVSETAVSLRGAGRSVNVSSQ
jgi:hypothetical protein